MSATYTVNWIDPIADALSVTFSDNPENPVSVPVDKSDPNTWSDSIVAYYTANSTPVIDAGKVLGTPIAIPPQS